MEVRSTDCSEGAVGLHFAQFKLTIQRTDEPDDRDEPDARTAAFSPEREQICPNLGVLSPRLGPCRSDLRQRRLLSAAGSRHRGRGELRLRLPPALSDGLCLPAGLGREALNRNIEDPGQDDQAGPIR